MQTAAAPKLSLVRLLGIGLKLSGAIESPEIYELAGRVAVEGVFYGHPGRNSRQLAYYCEQFFGKVDRACAQRITDALRLLDEQKFLRSVEVGCTRIFANFAMRNENRIRLVDGIRMEGLRPRFQRVVSCSVGRVLHPEFPFLVADVPKDYAPGLAALQVGQRATLPQIPKGFIVAVNNFPWTSFLSAWDGARSDAENRR